MKESLYTYIDPGIIHFMAYPDALDGEGEVVGSLESIARDDFFTAVEVTWIKDDDERERARKLLETSHLKVYYGAQPRLLTTGLDLNSSDDEERRQAVGTIKEGVDEALELGAEAVAFLSGKDVETDRDGAVDRLVDSISQICTYAGEKSEDLDVVLEVFDYDIDKCALVGPADLAAEVAERVKENHDNFGLMVDLSHLPLVRETAEEAIKPVLDHLVHIHIGNAVLQEDHPAYGDSHPRFGLEAGENDVEELIEFLRVLLDVGYLDGKTPQTVSFEVQPLPGESSEVVIANAKRVLKQAWARL